MPPKKSSETAKPIPFDEALRRLVNTPPKHKTAARSAKERVKPSLTKQKK